MSSVSLGSLTVGVKGDTSELKKSMSEAAKATDDAAKTVTQAGKKMGSAVDEVGQKASSTSRLMQGLGGAIASAFSIGSIKSFVGKAMEAEQTAALMQGTFGKGAASIEAWSNGIASSTGRSAGDIQKMAVSAQQLLAPLIGNEKAASGMSQQLSQLSIDLGSLYQVSDDEALSALQSGVMGNTKALRSMGIVINDDTMKRAAQNAGLGDNISKLSEAQLAQLRFNAILEQSSKAHGHATENANSFHNTMVGLGAAVDDAQEALGGALVPVLNDAAQAIRGAVDWFNKLNPEIQKVAGYVAGATAALTALAGVGAMVGLPILTIVAAIAAVITAIGIMKKVWDGDMGGMRTKTIEFLTAFRDGFKKIFGWVGEKVSNFVDFIGEKFIYLQAMIRGISAEEAGAMVTAMKSGGGLLDMSDAGAVIEDALAAGSDAVKGAIAKAPDMMKQGASFIFDAFKQGLGVLGDGIKQLGLSQGGGGGGKAAPSAAPVAYAGTAVSASAPEAPKKEAVDKAAQKDAAAAAQFISNLGDQLSQAAGSMGQAVSAVVQGAMLAGPVGAIVAGVMALLQHSEAFQKIVEVMNQMVTDLATALDPLFQAVMPLVQLVGNLVRAIAGPLSTMFSALTPVIEFITTIAEPLIRALSNLGTIFSAMAPVLWIVGRILTGIAPLFEAVGKILEGVTWVLKKVFGGIAWIFNGIIEAIAKVLERIDDFVPGNKLVGWAKEMRRGQINMDAFNNSLEDYPPPPPPPEAPPNEETKKFGENLAKLNESMANVPQGFKVTLARFNAAVAEDGASGMRDSVREGGMSAMQAMALGGKGLGQTVKTQPPLIIEHMEVKTDDPQAAMDAMRKAAYEAAMRVMGSTLGGNPYSTSRT